MTKNTNSSNSHTSRFDNHTLDELLAVVPLFLEVNLEDPEIEAMARSLLNALRKKGHPLQDADLENCDCLACLHLALMSAINNVHTVII